MAAERNESKDDGLLLLQLLHELLHNLATLLLLFTLVSLLLYLIKFLCDHIVIFVDCICVFFG